jgi:carbonic anhydrase/acetyltransferase-like protein (isoleucine patch superfamily)
MEWNSNGDYPQINTTAYVHSTAVIIGKVTIGKNVFIGPQVVIRADEPQSSIIIDDDCNVQDRVIIHALEGSIVEIKGGTSLSHGCIIHGPCKIGKGCFIGFGSVIFSACLANGVFVNLLAAVSGVNIPHGRAVPDGAVINTEQKAKALKVKTKTMDAFAKRVVTANSGLLKRYKRQK